MGRPFHIRHIFIALIATAWTSWDDGSNRLDYQTRGRRPYLEFTVEVVLSNALRSATQRIHY